MNMNVNDKTGHDPAGQDGSRWMANPFAWAAAATHYTIDAWQRTVLYADIRRQRGNQYREHLQEQQPNVLDFAAEPVMSGAELPRPVNYWLAHIVPGAKVATDPHKRPFIVVDPRAGHGPGIGGFKPDSEIGAALKAGHPCYFVGFLPDPVPGQTIEDVLHAQAAFVRKVGELHPHSIGKPVVIGNCQAGWQVLMTAAVWPDLFGPIIVAGSPVSYWAGDNPMRYAGGLLGGSWLTSLASDLGAGRFDGAWLVQNFENLDPANTLWAKQYNVYANVDTEGPRYLEFEKYWGGHVFLEGREIQYIVDNLFIGNRLSSAELTTSEGMRIDLRNIRSPIVVFCSYGDNITPPGQALGWITDLYRDDDDVAGHDQTIVFATHESIGHLGIFVSSSVGRKEHRKFASNIDIIDMLGAGIYRATVEDRPPEALEDDLAGDPYLMKLQVSSVEEVRAIVKPDPKSDARFAAAAAISQVNLALYRTFAQPWVRACATPDAAHWGQLLHPLRVGYEYWSDRHPLAATIAAQAQWVREHRQPTEPSNPFLLMQDAMSRAIVQGLDRYRDQRDTNQAKTFETVYGSAAVQALAGRSLGDVSPARAHPGNSPEHQDYLARELARQDADMTQGGLVEAVQRSLYYVVQDRGGSDERLFRHAWDLMEPRLAQPDFDFPAFRQRIRSQALLVRRNPEAAMVALPQLLARIGSDEIRAAAKVMTEFVNRGGLSPQESARLEEIQDTFEAAAARARTPAATAAESNKSPRNNRQRSAKKAARGTARPPTSE